MIMLLISTLYIHIWRKNKLDMMNVHYNIKIKERDKIFRENQNIKMLIEQHSRSEYIKNKAIDELNMHIPDPETLTVILDIEL